ncbi:MAG: Signal transduction histidine-protein kinase BarA [Proteobacteria bacterium]|nr:MAG: Signal transduction histidine-protein kinase BarA [Pseudomonadota bacterium]
MKLRNKIFILLVTIQTVLMLLFAVIAFHKINTRYVESNLQYTDNTSLYLQEEIMPMLMINDILGLEEYLENFSKHLDVARTNVIQKIVVKDQYSEPLTEKIFKDLRPERYGPIPSLARIFLGDYYRTKIYEIVYDNHKVGELEITISNRDLLNTSISITRYILAVWFIIFLCIIVVYHFVLKVLLQRVDDLYNIVNHIENGDIDSLEIKTSNQPDELAKLINIIKDTSSKVLNEHKNSQIQNIQKSQLLTNITNSILTPLNGIMGAIDLIKIKNPEASNNSELSFIEKSSNILLNQIINVLIYLELKESSTPINYSPCILSDVVYLAYKESKMALPDSTNIKMSYDNNDLEEKIYVKTDVVKLKVALKNIIDNAIAFTKQGYVKVDFSASKIDSKYIKYQVCIEDTGLGMSKSRLESINSSLKLSDKELNTKGFGLGLIISKLILSNLKGEISLHSIENHGTTVIVSLMAERASISKITQQKNDS